MILHRVCVHLAGGTTDSEIQLRPEDLTRDSAKNQSSAIPSATMRWGYPLETVYPAWHLSEFDNWTHRGNNGEFATQSAGLEAEGLKPMDNREKIIAMLVERADTKPRRS
jgi:hypothetical protein